MARLPRVVIADIPHHVTQRGNARQVILSGDADRATYLEMLSEYSQLYGMSLLGYCLMSNHVHLIVIPHTPQALSHSLRQAHGRYATYWNARQSSTGHVWQGRFYSCPLDESHLWAAIRYAELNPVRAGMAESAPMWRWSSGALRPARARAAAGNGTLAETMDRGGVVRVSHLRRIGCRSASAAPLDPYWTTAGCPGIRVRSRARNLAFPGSAKRRTTEEADGNLTTGQPGLGCVAMRKTGERPVCPQVSGLLDF